MSAEVLREAARLMRDRAEAVPAGPWEAGDRIVWNDVPHNEWDGSSIVSDSDEGDGGCESPEIAEYVASMHPVVADAVASLLSMSADHARGRGDFCESCLDQALAVARAYLGA